MISAPFRQEPLIEAVRPQPARDPDRDHGRAGSEKPFDRMLPDAERKMKASTSSSHGRPVDKARSSETPESIDQKTAAEAEGSLVEATASRESDSKSAKVKSETLTIPGASAQEVAGKKSSLAQGMQKILDAAREAISEIDMSAPGADMKLRQVTATAAHEMSELLKSFDAETGANSSDVFRGLLSLEYADFPESMQNALAENPVEALVAMTATALGISMPVGSRETPVAQSVALAPSLVTPNTNAIAEQKAERNLEAIKASASGAQQLGQTHVKGNLQAVSEMRVTDEAAQRQSSGVLQSLQRFRQEPEAVKSGAAVKSGPAQAASDPRRAAMGPSAEPTAAWIFSSEGMRTAEAGGDPLRGLSAGMTQDAQRAFEAVRGMAPDRAAVPQGRLSASIAGQIMDVRANVASEIGRTRIELSPRGLGELEVDLRTDPSGRIRIVIRAENPMVLEALRADKDMLGDMLSGGRNGVDLEFEMFNGDDDTETSGHGSTDAALELSEATDAVRASEEQKQTITSDILDILT